MVRTETRAYVTRRAVESGLKMDGQLRRIWFIEKLPDGPAESIEPTWRVDVTFGGSHDEDFIVMTNEKYAKMVVDWVGEMCHKEHDADPAHPAWRVTLAGPGDVVAYSITEGPGTPEEPAVCVCGGYGYVLDEHDKIQRCHNCNP